MSAVLENLMRALVTVMTIIPGIWKMAKNSGDRDGKDFSDGIAQIVIGVLLAAAVNVLWGYIDFGGA